MSSKSFGREFAALSFKSSSKPMKSKSIPFIVVISLFSYACLNLPLPFNFGRKSSVNFSRSNLKYDFCGFGDFSAKNSFTSWPSSASAFKSLK
jgi:hypothetical protein